MISAFWKLALLLFVTLMLPPAAFAARRIVVGIGLDEVGMRADKLGAVSTSAEACYGPLTQFVRYGGGLGESYRIFVSDDGELTTCHTFTRVFEGGAWSAWWLSGINYSTFAYVCDYPRDPYSYIVVSKNINLPCGDEKKLSLAISSQASQEIRPIGTDGNSAVELVAKVVEGAAPKAGVAVQFAVAVTVNSGGHEHHDAVRPKGSLSKLSGTTDANGEVRVGFAASELAGIHTVKATCTTCSNTEAIQEIKVKVPDLIAISPEPPRNADGTFLYALTSVDPIHAGNGRYHRNQYYLTQQSLINLTQLISEFANAGWGTVALNDASLYWGGVYDIVGNWGAPHRGHRDGREIDISFARAQNPVASAKQRDVYKKFCETAGVNVPFSILHHFVLIPHFHVYLEKQKACNRTER